MQALSLAVVVATQMASANAASRINFDRNGNPVCSYGQIRSCQAAAGLGDMGAKQYVDQRIANNPNPNKTTFYNYSPPAPVKVVTPTRPTCSAAMQRIYGADCR